MELFAVGLFTLGALAFSWTVRLRRDTIGSYLAGTMWALHFFVPGMYALAGNDLARRYATDAMFTSMLGVAYLVLLASLLAQRLRVTRRILQCSNTLSRRRSNRVNYVPIIAYTSYLAYEALSGLAAAPTGISRGEQALSTIQADSETGSLQFLAAFLAITAHFSLYKLLTGGRARMVKGVSILALWFGLQLVSSAVSGTYRSPVIFLCIATAITLHMTVGPIRLLKSGLVVALLLAPFIMSELAFFRAGDSTAGTTFSVTERVLHGTSGVATSLDFYDLALGIDEGTYEYEFGEQLKNTALVWVPRILWDNKPPVSFSFRKSVEIHGPITPRNWVRTFTAWGEGYSQFGYLGVIVYSGLLALIVAGLKAIWIRVPELTYPLAAYVASFPLLARADLFTFVSRLLPIAVVATIVILARSRGFRTSSVLTVARHESPAEL